MGKYKLYSEEQIVVLDGYEMQTSWEFVYQIMKNFNYRNDVVFLDYCEQPFDGTKNYNRDQINDYLREIQIYSKVKKLDGLLVIIKNINYVLSKEFDKDYVLEQLQSTIFESEVINLSIDIFGFEEADINLDDIYEITNGPWGNPSNHSYYSETKSEEEISVRSIVVVNQKKYMVYKYSKLTKEYTLLECLNYQAEIKCKIDSIDTVLQLYSKEKSCYM